MESDRRVCAAKAKGHSDKKDGARRLSRRAPSAIALDYYPEIGLFHNLHQSRTECRT